MDQRSRRGEATREKIVETALRLFTELGYGGVSIETVLQECNISRGALYHHYSSKDALFEAVLEAAELRIMAAASKAAQKAKNPLDALRAGCLAWLDLASTDPIVRRIVLIDAPVVLGWEKWRAIDSRYGLGLIKAGLTSLSQSGRIAADRIDIYAHVLLAVLMEVALLLARSTGKKDVLVARETIEQVLSQFVGPAAPHK